MNSDIKATLTQILLPDKGLIVKAVYEGISMFISASAYENALEMVMISSLNLRSISFGFQLINPYILYSDF